VLSSTGILFCRHAATDHNVDQRFISTTDLPLGAHGRTQCEALRVSLRAFDVERCLVSPMRRCLETRALALPEIPFEIETALGEVAFGEWEGQTRQWVESRTPELLEQRRRDPAGFRPPCGESIEEAAQRLAPVAARLSHGTVPTIVIGHRISLGILERLLRNLPLDSQAVAGLATAEFRIVRA
jgi:broad specificity phosphatase PhoE